ncbi:MAG: fructosamine kinase family protein, partial [Flavisolibacter sp.]
MTFIPGIILDRLAVLAGHAKQSIKFTRIGGGSINDTFRLQAADRLLFCKINSASKFPHLFLKEKEGLEAIASTGCIGTPAIIDYGEEGSWQFLLLDYI